MSTPTPALESERLAVNAREAAKLLGISQRHLWAMNAAGRLPRPVYFGRSARWNLAELRRWLDAGCPARVAWESVPKVGTSGS